MAGPAVTAAQSFVVMRRSSIMPVGALAKAHSRAKPRALLLFNALKPEVAIKVAAGG